MSIILAAAVVLAQAPPGVVTAYPDWEDAPVAAGDWSYHRTATGSQAVFGNSGGIRLTIQCNLASRTVTVERADSRAPQRVMTSDIERQLTVPTLPARDPLLDAIAFTRGRFALSGGGMDLLVVPSSPEAARSIEDCRI